MGCIGLGSIKSIAAEQALGHVFHNNSKSTPDGHPHAGTDWSEYCNPSSLDHSAKQVIGWQPRFLKTRLVLWQGTWKEIEPTLRNFKFERWASSQHLAAEEVLQWDKGQEGQSQMAISIVWRRMPKQGMGMLWLCGCMPSWFRSRQLGGPAGYMYEILNTSRG